MNAQRAVAVRASCTRSCCGKPSRPEDLTGYLDRDTLIAVWPELHLPEGVRQAREEHHPQLRRVTWDGLMPVGDLHRQIAALALVGAGEHGFALGGGNALLARGVISRPTRVAGLFTGQEHRVQAAAGAVAAALRGAGFEPGRRDQAAGLTGIFPGMGEGWPSGS